MADGTASGPAQPCTGPSTQSPHVTLFDTLFLQISHHGSPQILPKGLSRVNLSHFTAPLAAKKDGEHAPTSITTGGPGVSRALRFFLGGAGKPVRGARGRCFFRMLARMRGEPLRAGLASRLFTCGRMRRPPPPSTACIRRAASATARPRTVDAGLAGCRPNLAAYCSPLQVFGVHPGRSPCVK
jgi:hypothetical protein